MLEHYNISKQINSHYLMEDEVKYLTENIDHCEIYYLNGKNSITSIIKKK